MIETQCPRTPPNPVLNLTGAVTALPPLRFIQVESAIGPLPIDTRCTRHASEYLHRDGIPRSCPKLLSEESRLAYFP